MPVYDYRCLHHGIFNELQTADRHDRPVACPQCGQLSARIIRLPPELLTLPKATRRAHAANEQACHEPVSVAAHQRRQQERTRDKKPHAHCGCDPDRAGSGIGHRRSSLIYTARGDKMFPSQRPWMISH